MSPLETDKKESLKRKLEDSSLTMSSIRKSFDENINVSNFANEKKNRFFEEMSQNIEKNKEKGTRNICKPKIMNETVKPTFDDGSLVFYWYYAYEENIQKSDPLIFLFGKVYNQEKDCFESLSVIIKNLNKKIYLLPKLDKIGEPNLKENMIVEFEKLRQTKFSYIKKGTYKQIKKKYCLELPIPYSKFSNKFLR